MIGAAASGAATWLLAEYLIHRFLGHARRIRTEFGREHTRHHAEGNYFAPARKKVRAAVPSVLLAFALASAALGLARGAAYAGGFSLMYLAYELFHRRLHTHPPRGPIGRFLRRHHFRHHFVDPRTNQGVTTPVFDLLFRTYAKADPIKVPAKLAMPWLLDPATGAVREAHAGDYLLAPARRGRPAGP